MRSMAAAVLAGVLAVSPAGAATVTISMVDSLFVPKSAQVPMGTTVVWHNDGAFSHTSTQDAPFSAWNTGTVASGGSSRGVVMAWAGTYPYHCIFHAAFGMRGSLLVPATAAPAGGRVGRTFVIRVSTRSAPAGLVFDVQRRVGSGPWLAYRKGLRTATVAFVPAQPGSYSFRARPRRLATNAAPRYSPAARIVVTR